MTTDIFTVCNDATEHLGILDIDRAYCRLACINFPTVLPMFTVAIRMRGDLDDEGEHEFQLSMTELDGKLLGPPVTGQFKLQAEENATHAWMCAIVRIAGIRICEPNEYLLSLQIDGETIASTPLIVAGEPFVEDDEKA